MPTPYKGYASLLYYHLIHSGRHDVAKVAPQLGISASVLYKYCEADSTFPADLIPALYNATKERDFVDFCLKGTDQMPAPRPEAAPNGRSLEMETLDVVSAVGALSAHIQGAIEDGRLSEIEIKRIEKTIGDLFQEIEGVRQKIRMGTLKLALAEKKF